MLELEQPTMHDNIKLFGQYLSIVNHVDYNRDSWYIQELGPFGYTPL